MKYLKSSIAVLVATFGLMGQVQADTLSWLSGQTGTTRTILYKSDAATSTALGATLWTEVDFKLNSMNASTSIFDVSIKNLSFGAGTDTLMSFGIDVVAPKLSGVSDNSGTWDAVLNTNLPSFQKVDLCLFASNGCTGGAIGNGLNKGATAPTFQLTLTTASNFQTSGIQFNSPYGSKFQNVGTLGKSYELGGCDKASTACGGGTPPVEIQVPEPGSLALVGLALLGLAVTARRKA